MEERRIMAVRDGRNPYGSRGGYVVSSRGRRGRGRRRGDRGMDYASDYGDMTRRGRYGDYGEDMRSDYEGNDMRGRDYGEDMARGSRGGRGRGRSDYGDYDYGDMRMDGHYGRQGGYEPVEFMGYCNGYYGMPNQDYGRGDMRRGGSRMDYGYDMRGGRRDYGYDDFGYEYDDYGSTLSEKELEEWCKKMKSQLSEQEKQMFSKEAVMQRAKALNRPMEGFGEKELYTATLMWYTDNREFFGQNIDFAVKGGYAFLADKDVKVKGAEKLCVYYDEIVMGGEE